MQSRLWQLHFACSCVLSAVSEDEDNEKNVTSTAVARAGLTSTSKEPISSKSESSNNRCSRMSRFPNKNQPHTGAKQAIPLKLWSQVVIPCFDIFVWSAFSSDCFFLCVCFVCLLAVPCRCVVPVGVCCVGVSCWSQFLFTCRGALFTHRLLCAWWPLFRNTCAWLQKLAVIVIFWCVAKTVKFGGY